MHAFVPQLSSPRGIQPAEYTPFPAVNETTLTLSVGESGIFDFKKSVATSVQAGGTDSIWAVLKAHTNTNAFLSYAIPAVYIGKKNGDNTDLLDGEEGMFTLAGIVVAEVENIGSGTAVAGSPIVCKTTSTQLQTTDDQVDFARMSKIVGFTLEDMLTTAVATQAIYFNAFGIGTAFNAIYAP